MHQSNSDECGLDKVGGRDGGWQRDLTVSVT
jgi:hypothetical protein